jgi:DNA-binding MarR family transcriptional regulator
MDKIKKRTSRSGEDIEKITFFNDREAKTWKLLLDTAHVVMKAREKELQKYDISAIKSVVLVLVHSSNNTVTPSQLARWTHRDPHTVSELLFRMEKEGLIEKVQDLPSKNQIRIALTSKGLDAYYKTIKRESIHDIMSVLAANEMRQMRSQLKRIRDRALLRLK